MLQCTTWPYSDVWISRYPYPTIPSHADTFLVGGMTISCPSVSAVESLSYFSPWGIQFSGSPTTYLRQITVLLGPLTGRNNLTLWGPLPPSPISYPDKPSSSMPSGGLIWLLSSNRPSQWEGVRGIWRATIFPVTAHMLGTPSSTLPISPPLPAIVSSCRHPDKIAWWWGVSGSAPAMSQTFHREGIRGWVGYLPP